MAKAPQAKPADTEPQPGAETAENQNAGADTQAPIEPTPPAREVDTISAKLTVKHLGDPAKAKALMADDQNEVTLGYIYGRITGIARGKNPDQVTTHTYLKGMFEADSRQLASDGTLRPLKRSAKCILHDSIQNDLEELFDIVDDKTGQVVKEAKSATASYDFKIAVKVVRSSAAAGYSWAFKNVMEVKAADPLAELRAIGQPAPKLLAAPIPTA